MGLAGAGFGASKALEQIVAERMIAEKLQAEIANRQQQAEMEQARQNEMIRQNQWERGRADRLDEERRTVATAAADKDKLEQRGRSNMAGVVAMGVDPSTARREIAFSALNSGASVPGGVMDAIKSNTKEYTYTDPKTGAKSLRQANLDELPEGGIDLGREPEKPTAQQRRQVFNVGNGTLVDETGKVIYGGGNAQGVDPVKAREKGVAMLNAAQSLRNHKGLGNLTGARIGNPDYMLGVSETPIAGSQAADAQSYFNQLKSLFTLDNIGLLKGVLSDSDMKILQQASTSLDTAMRDETFAAELDDVILKLKAAFGDGNQAVNLPQMNPTSSRGTGGSVPAGKRFTITKIGG